MQFKDRLSLQCLSFPSERIVETYDSGGGNWKDICFGEFCQQTEKMRRVLEQKKIGPKETVIFLGENHPWWLQAFFAVVENSSIVIPVDGAVPDERLLAIIKHSGVRGIVASPSQYSRLEKMVSSFSGNFTVFRNDMNPWLENSGSVPVDSNTKPGAKSEIPDDIAAIFYTSGTTGLPKGIMLSHKALIASIRIGIEIGNVGESDTLLTLLPFTHVYGLADAGLVPLASGTRIILAQTYNPIEIFQIISRFRVSFLNVVPRLAEVLLAVLTQSDSKLSGLNLVIGGASCRPEIIRALRKRGLKTTFGFGMTETVGGISGNEGEPAESVGICHPDVEIKIDNQKDGIGEILIKSPTLLTGILNDPEETAKLFKDGFLKSGDLGYLTPDGHLIIKGRIKDVIVCGGGMNVYPDELEGRLDLTGFVEEFSVIGMKEGGHEFPMLVVKERSAFFKERPTINPHEYIHDQVKRQTVRWAEWEKFRRISFVDKPLPRSFNQKVQRHVLQKSLAVADDSSDTTFDAHLPAREKGENNEHFDRCVKFLARFLSKKVDDSFLKASVCDFPQLDSLGLIALAAAFESSYKIRISDFVIEQETKIEEIAQIFSERLSQNSHKADLTGAADSGSFLPPERDNEKGAVAARLDFLKGICGDELEEFLPPANGAHLAGNIEGFIGYAQIPIGLAGPLKVIGDHATGEYYLPLATTEGALVSSVSRGAKLVTAAGGVRVKVFADGVIRSPVFLFDELGHLVQFKNWLEGMFDEIKAVAQSTTRHGRLEEMEMFPIGLMLGVRMVYYSGDASGQNMCTIATQKVLDYIKSEYKGPMRECFLECNISGDKKINALNYTRHRGKKVIAEVLIPSEHIESILHASAERMVQMWETAVIGSLQAHSFGVQAHFSNLLTALYLATGQDAACASESANGISHLAMRDGKLQACVTLPGIMVATIGGGTRLSTQQACLRIIGCTGQGKALKLAEITAAGVLAAELSLIGAMAAGDFATAHAKYGRK
ncbi:MAG: AMP-binding protein [Candidatus Riflebacteria bacterium]|nr:AMP-binding protein [Candidatus Riflebacteria bacterium]